MIPWATLLKHAPTIVAAADTLLARTRSTRSNSAPHSVEERVARLEQSDRETAQLLREIAEQVNGLTLMQAKMARRVRMALVIAGVAAVLAAVALASTVWP